MISFHFLSYLYSPLNSSTWFSLLFPRSKNDFSLSHLISSKQSKFSLAATKINLPWPLPTLFSSQWRVTSKAQVRGAPLSITEHHLGLPMSDCHITSPWLLLSWICLWCQQGCSISLLIWGLGWFRPWLSSLQPPPTPHRPYSYPASNSKCYTAAGCRLVLIANITFHSVDTRNKLRGPGLVNLTILKSTDS